MSERSQIKCPNCTANINIDDLVYKQLYAEIDAQYQDKIKEAEERNRKNAAYLRQENEKLKEQKIAFQEEMELRVKDQLKEEKRKMEQQLRKNIDEEKSEEIAVYRKQLDEQNEKIRESHKMRAELEQVKREKSEIEVRIKADVEKQFSEKILEEQKRLRADVEHQMQNRLTEKDQKLLEGQHQMEQMRKQIEELQRKAEQSSMQLQGEVQEIAIEEYLRATFRFDLIKEVPKGVNGADCIQEVYNNFGKRCGTILYESKRTKAFGGEWIEKFKADIRQIQANLGILVTKTLPKELLHMGQIDGVWICTFEEFKTLSMILREQIIKVYEAAESQENKGEKMEFLYNYLTGAEFRQTIEAIVEGFTQMREDLQKERNTMEKLWKQREKQIDKIVIGTVHMYGSIKGIAGNAIGTVSALELSE